MSDTGDVWKLFLYPIVLILLLGFFLNIIIKPFIDEGIPTQYEASSLLTFAKATLSTIGIIIPNSIENYLDEQLDIFGYLPENIQTISFILIIASWGYVAYALIPLI